MARAYTSGVVAAPADEVWAVVREFNGLPSWHPAIKGSEIVEGTDMMAGAVRRLDLGEGNAVSERLVALDETDRSLTYEFTDPGPFAARTYRSTYRVAPVTDTGKSFLEWWCWFDAESGDEAGLVDTFGNGVYKTGIGALQERFGS